ncbi:MAG: hypothetical protein HOW97_41140 [Catenulispora sp.]|nr:hypothetical protein [Catenulispora sp.]
MTKTSVGNGTDDLLCLWLEPWATDYWMRPDEVFTVATEANDEENPFNVFIHDQGVTVWVNTGFDAEVTDQNGTVLDGGHQRPEDFDATSRWITTWTNGRTASLPSEPPLP